MTHSRSQETISFSSSFCGGQLWMSWGFPHMELKKHHHHHIIYFSHSGIQNRHLVPSITVRVLCQMSWNGLRHILISWKLSILSWVRRGILAADCGFFVCDVCLDLMASHTPLTTNGMDSLLYCDQWETHLADSCIGERWNVSGISGRLGGPAVRTHIRDGILGWEGRPRQAASIPGSHQQSNQTNNLRSYDQDKTKDLRSWNRSCFIEWPSSKDGL